MPIYASLGQDGDTLGALILHEIQRVIMKNERVASGTVRTVSRAAKSATVLYAKVSTYMGWQMFRKAKGWQGWVIMYFTIHLSPG